jgi:hypothetical protein
MEPFQQIFPDAHEPVSTLVLEKKTAGIPKGRYGFIECYCIDPKCDCRRVTIVVLNEKMRQKAVICFGFDQQGPFAGPFLDSSHRHAPYADALLEFFVQSLSGDPAVLERLYRHYRQVRQRLTGSLYRDPFPKPGELVYRVMPPPDLEAEIEQSLKNLAPEEGMPVVPRKRRGGRWEIAAAEENGMAFFVSRYVTIGSKPSVGDLMALRSELRHYVLEKDDAGDELASLLAELYQRSPQADEEIQAALRVLSDTLTVIDVEMETDGIEARRRMERFQGALAQRVFTENEDVDLCAAVCTIFLRTRAEILPVMREATTRIMVAGAPRSDLHDVPGEDLMTGLVRSLESMGITSPFEGVREMLKLFTLTEPAMQVGIIGEMLQGGEPLVREIAALMLFHQEGEVRTGVSHLLAQAQGELITPETLRRLIVCRNWFEPAVRKNADLAIANARRARVECASLTRPESQIVHVSAIDATGAHSFEVIVPDRKGFACCSILLKSGIGVADASILPLKSKREMNSHLKSLRDAGFMKSTPEELDLELCQALAERIGAGNVPPPSLVRVAELLGRDRWIAAR